MRELDAVRITSCKTSLGNPVQWQVSNVDFMEDGLE